jgi:porin
LHKSVALPNLMARQGSRIAVRFGLLICAQLVLLPSAARAGPDDAGPSEGQLPHSHLHAAAAINEDQPPLLVEATYTFDVWGSVSGGRERGSRYLDNLDVVVEADLERLAGWRGAELHVYGLYNNGRSISELIGDQQAISNIESGLGAVRLYEAWISQSIGDRASIKIGLYDLNSEFDTLETSGLFVGSPHGIGTDFAQSGENGPSIFPVTSLSGRLEWRATPNLIFRGAVLDGIPGNPERPGRTAIRLNDDEGALLVGEADVQLNRLRLLFGHWRYTGEFDRFDGTRARGNHGWYLRGEMPISGAEPESSTAVHLFFRLGVASPQFNMFDSFASGGITARGLLPGRSDDELGLAFATAITSHGYRVSNNSEQSETLLELTYRTQLSSWLTLQPSVQYVVNPGTDPSLRNALAVGLRSQISVRF